MKKPSAATIVAVMILITIGSVSALNLIDPSYRSLGSDQQAVDHVNVPVHCDQGYWSLKVSQPILDTLPTLASVPDQRTEIATAGDQVATFKILRIDPSTVTGNRSTVYPLGYCCTTMTISVGDDVGISCQGLVEKVARLDFLDQKVWFSVQIVPHDGCPICLSGDTVID